MTTWNTLASQRAWQESNLGVAALLRALVAAVETGEMLTLGKAYAASHITEQPGQSEHAVLIADRNANQRGEQSHPRQPLFDRGFEPSFQYRRHAL